MTDMKPCRLRSGFALLLILASGMGCSWCQPDQPEKPDGKVARVDAGGTRPADDHPTVALPDCGAVQSWDADGDGISDRVENNDAHNYFDTQRCDQDPSQPVAKYWDGSLAGGINLVDSNAGYRHYLGSDDVDADDWGTLELVNCVEAVGRGWKAYWIKRGRSRFPRVAITDLSRKKGGKFPPHVSHQNGLDADLRYVRKDGKERPLDIKYSPAAYDSVATKALFKLFVKHCDVLFLLVDTERIGFSNSALGVGDARYLRHANGHSNHFHLRLKMPSG